MENVELGEAVRTLQRQAEKTSGEVSELARAVHELTVEIRVQNEAGKHYAGAFEDLKLRIEKQGQRIDSLERSEAKVMTIAAAAGAVISFFGTKLFVLLR